MQAGRTPKQTMSQRESIWMPKDFSSSVAFFRVRASRPSKASRQPDTMRQTMAKVMWRPLRVMEMPMTELTRDRYVRTTP